MQPDYFCVHSHQYKQFVWMDSHWFYCILFLFIGDKTLWSAPAVSGNVTLVSSLEKAQPMRTNVSRWDPVLVGLVQDGGAAVSTTEL